MDVAWVQVFVLTLAECIAPAGKTVCQEHEFELMFLSQSDCEVALEQLVTLKDAAENVIVDKSKSGCAPSARQQSVFFKRRRGGRIRSGQEQLAATQQPGSTDRIVAEISPGSP